MTTQADIIDNASLASSAPILKEASLQIADPQVRYMGTVGGNVANGDPGNDMRIDAMPRCYIYSTWSKWRARSESARFLSRGLHD